MVKLRVWVFALVCWLPPPGQPNKQNKNPKMLLMFDVAFLFCVTFCSFCFATVFYCVWRVLHLFLICFIVLLTLFVCLFVTCCVVCFVCWRFLFFLFNCFRLCLIRFYVFICFICLRKVCLVKRCCFTFVAKWFVGETFVLLTGFCETCFCCKTVFYRLEGVGALREVSGAFWERSRGPGEAEAQCKSNQGVQIFNYLIAASKKTNSTQTLRVCVCDKRKHEMNQTCGRVAPVTKQKKRCDARAHKQNKMIRYWLT
jgi:hypothetical protein